MRFQVRAYADGRITNLVVEAINLDDARRQIAAQAMRPMEVRELECQPLRFGQSTASRFETLLFTQELLALLEAGLSIIEAIDTLAERQKPGPSRGILDQLTQRLREGKSLAAALETLPDIFPGLLVGIVRSAERTGNLTEALTRYVDYRHRVDGLRSKVVNAAIYPVLLLIVAAGVTLFLGGYVVPRFAAVYQGAGRQLPWASELLLHWGKFARAHMPALLGALTLLFIGMIWGIRTLSRRGGIAILIRRIPIFSEQAHAYEISRIYLTLGMLLESGLSVVPALALAEEVVPSHLRTALQRAGESIRTGEKLSVAFERVGLTTSVALRMLHVGEESGQLGEMMARTARFHDEETGRWIDRFSRIAEPTLMVGIGLVIGTIVVLLYMPIFDLAGSLR